MVLLEQTMIPVSNEQSSLNSPAGVKSPPSSLQEVAGYALFQRLRPLTVRNPQTTAFAGEVVPTPTNALVTPMLTDMYQV